MQGEQGALTMILGLGNDMIDIRRVERTLERFGERFVQRVFTATEQRKSERRAARAASYAKRFAAKEACSKALGTGFRRGVYWRDLGVVNEPSGRPTMVLTGEAGRHLAGHDACRPPGGHSRHLDRRLPLCPGRRHHFRRPRAESA
jgi:holo-[acyl-carrier protein] synthase